MSPFEYEWRGAQAESGRYLLALDSPVVRIWLLVNLLSISGMFFAITLQVFIPEDSLFLRGSPLLYLLVAVFILDIPFECLTEVRAEGLVTRIYRVTVRGYLTGLRGVSDLLSVLLVLVWKAGVIPRSARFVVLLLFVKLAKLLLYDRTLLSILTNPLLKLLYRCFKLVYLELLFCNLAGAIFYFLD